MRDRRWLPELDEHDRDVYESELMYDRWIQGRQAVALQALDEGYDRDRDDPNSFRDVDPFDRLKSEGGGGHLGE